MFKSMTTMKGFSLAAAIVFVLGAARIATPHASGAATTWTGSSANSANWTDGGNWSAGVPAGGVGADITFSGTTRNTINDDASNVGNYGGGSYGNILFNSTAGAFVINQGSSSILGLNGNLTNNSVNTQTINVPVQVICNNPGGNRIITVIAGGSLVINEAISENSGSGNGLIKAGGGTLTLAAANNYSAGTTVLEGILNIQHSDSLGIGDVRVAGGATLKLGSSAAINASANLLLTNTSAVNLAFAGTNIIRQLSFDGGSTFQAAGTWGAASSVAQYSDSRFAGAGILSVQPPLALYIQLSGTNVLLSWPSASASALSLFSAANLTATTDWQPVTNSVALDGTLNVVTMPNNRAQQYFQLREAVDPSTMNRKLLMGYQGWFGAPGDGSQNNQWFHWFRSQTPTAANVTVDFLPDLSEFDADELFPNSMTYSNGTPVKLYSAYSQKTVVRHFKWMKDNSLDGVFLQRFASELSSPSLFAFRNHVTSSVRLGAETYGRVFAIMYDISGQPTNTLVSTLTNDWQYLTNTLQVTQSPRYLRHNGKPVVAIWGFGFSGRSDTPQQAQQVINYFKSAGCTVMGGLLTYWRTLNNDTQTNAAWAAVFRSFDIISPWSVGRCGDNNGADSFRTSLIVPDLAAATSAGREYMPVIFPGFSWTNLNAGPFNQIPRHGGAFYWRQAYNAILSGCTMIYGVMFDEVDEGTAMFKLEPTRAELPAAGNFVPLNVDGINLPSDWYLRLANVASEMLRGDIPLQTQVPIVP
jgi:autotransporter-associated beta strand protein